MTIWSRWNGSPGGFRSCSEPRADDTDARSKGFTLIEVLVAFVILAMALVALLQVFSMGLRSTETAEMHVKATRLAQSKLASFAVDRHSTDALFAEGRSAEMQWRLRAKPYAGEGSSLEGVDAWRLYEVSVSVGWDESGRRKPLSLSTLKLVARR